MPGRYEHVATICNRRGKNLFCKYFEPMNPREGSLSATSDPGCCRAIVFIAHGYGEHCLLYCQLARLLAFNRYFVMTHDHVGHGNSDGARAQIDTFQKYVDDVFFHIERVKIRFPDLPVYICGHSMGGTIAILAALRSPNYFDGLILIAPAVKTNPALTTPFRVNLVKYLRVIFPRFPVASLDLNLLSRCPERVKEMKDDPYRYKGYCKAGFGASLIEAMEEIEEKVSNLSVPFILLQGEYDKICIPEGAAFLNKNAESIDKTLKCIVM
ncbi:monoglyceride lipase isoform X2 [Parasteatoda tepidariorum]|uniref:monoglyceride lipase isoform X2 n=1 Tax=Parasteatoda tepidariorum TaxID=114398 RepID=UPI0039BC7A63